VAQRNITRQLLTREMAGSSAR